jgi:SAM-dependent methyltransferase
VARRGATVIGDDIAGDLLEAARANARAENLPIEYQIGDAETLPFADGSFDAVVSTCGVMFASRPEAAARELARVCRTGGRIALTAWTTDGNLFKMFQVMRACRRTDPAPASPFAWGGREQVTELLGKDSTSLERARRLPPGRGGLDLRSGTRRRCSPRASTRRSARLPPQFRRLP